MHVSEDGRVSGSIDRAKLAQLYAGTDDPDLLEHYAYMAAFDGFMLEARKAVAELVAEPEPVKKTAAKKTTAKESTGGD